MNHRADRGITAFLEQSAIVWKTALGSAIVWELARLTGSRHPYLAPLTFILCLQATVGQSLRYALYRSVGTVIGVLLIGAFAKSIPVTAWALGVALLVCTAMMKLVRASDLLIHQVALSILFVLYFENHSSGYAWDRAKDTLIGAAVSVMFILFLFPPNAIRKTEQAIDKVVQNLVDTANLVAEVLQQRLPQAMRNPSERLNVLLDDVNEITESLKKVQQGVPFQVYLGKADVTALANRCHRVRDVCIHFVALARTFADDMSEADRMYWSNRIHSLAKEIPAHIYSDPRVFADPPDNDSMTADRQVAAFDEAVSETELEAIIRVLRGFTRHSKM